MTALIISVPASVGLAAGVTALRWAWMRRAQASRARRVAVAAGWALVGLGLAGWALSGPPDTGLARGGVLFVTLALAAVAASSLATQRPRTTPAPKPGPRAAPAAAGGDWRQGAARLAGGIFVAPAFGALAGLMWPAFGPGDPATRLVAMTFTAVLAAAGALVSILASARPARASARLAAASGLLAAIALAPAALAGRL